MTPTRATDPTTSVLLPAPRAVRTTPLRLAAWTRQLDAPADEPTRTKLLARAGGLTAVVGLVLYLSWRVAFTMPPGGSSAWFAWALVCFEALAAVRADR